MRTGDVQQVPVSCRLGYDCAPGFAKEEKVVDETKQVGALPLSFSLSVSF